MTKMAGKRDFYEVLGVDRGASDAAIAAAYRKLAVRYHPDKNPGDADAIGHFKEAAEAFEVLNNSDKRSRYDRFGHAGLEGMAGARFNDVNDIFEAFGDMFGDGLFGNIFGGGGKRRTRARKGSDVRCDVALDLLEAARGVTKSIRYGREDTCEGCQGTGARNGAAPEVCRYCGGQGQVVQSSGIFRVQTTCPSCRGSGSSIKDKCGQCGGQGQVLKRIEREVAIPAGVDSGTRLKLAGEGNPTPGGAPGDCYCFITVREHPLFHREGQHLVCQVPITFTQAALGASVEVPTLDGRESFEIPPGTQHGELFKLRGRGMPGMRQRGHGDLVVQVTLEVPKSMNARQEQLLREFAEEEQANVSPHRKSFFEKLKDYFIPDSPQSPSRSGEEKP